MAETLPPQERLRERGRRAFACSHRQVIEGRDMRVQGMGGSRFRSSLLSWLLIGLVTALSTPQPAAAMTIDATFNPNLSAAAQSVIQDAIAFYQQTFSDPITVRIEFHALPTGLGHSDVAFYDLAYAAYRAALIGDATSADDQTATGGLPDVQADTAVTSERRAGASREVQQQPGRVRSDRAAVG